MTIKITGTERVLINNGQWQAPIWEAFRPAVNTTSICTGASAAQAEIIQLPQTWQEGVEGYTIPAAGLAVNDVIEVCADYRDNIDRPVIWRRNMRITAITAKVIEFDLYKTLALAMKAAKIAKKEIEKRNKFAVSQYVHVTRHRDEPQMMQHHVICNFVPRDANEFDPFEIKGRTKGKAS